MPTKNLLDVYFNDKLVGRLCSDSASLSFKYDDNYLKNKSSTKISASMPLGLTEYEHHIAAPFFSGLLPDGEVRNKLAKCLNISPKNTFALLEKIGGECAGAISLYPTGVHAKENEEPTYRVLEIEEANAILKSLSQKPFLAGDGDIRMSGAGAQDKLMISFIDDKIAIPTGNTPSTHIIKPAITGYKDSVFNEFFCMKLAQSIGLNIPDVQIYWLEEIPYYLIERYDRVTSKDRTIRLHQEDFCQALHIPPEIKYENEGGPSLKQCFSFLDNRIQNGYMAGKNKLLFLQGVIYNFLVGNGDAHGKNFSILYKDYVETLAPFYDILCTTVYSNPFKNKMAMKIGGNYKFKSISLHNWEKLSNSIGFRFDFVKNQIGKIHYSLNETCPKLIQKLNSNNKTYSLIYDEISQIIDNNSRQILNK